MVELIDEEKEQEGEGIVALVVGLLPVGENGGVSGSEERGDVFGRQLVLVVDKKPIAVMVNFDVGMLWDRFVSFLCMYVGLFLDHDCIILI